MASAGEIVIALGPATGSLSGSVRAGAGPEQPFEGWLGLLAALQAVIGDGAAAVTSSNEGGQA